MKNSPTLLLAIAFSILWSVSSAHAKARYDTMHFVPAPKEVKIDGNLSDWDLSGGIDGYITPDTRAMRSMKFYGMYDAEALYMAGDISDLTPMMNAHDPAVNAGQAWDADSLQFRIFLKPTFPGQGSSFEPKPDPTVVHLLLWYFTPKAQANLQVLLGWNSAPRPGQKDGVVPPSDFQAAYRKRADGSSYVLEYRIPWKTMSDEYRLKAGDETAATVNCLWGTPDGTKTIGGGGWLYELMSTSGFPFQSAACWGKAIFPEKGHLPASANLSDAAPEPPIPLRFEYELSKDGAVTVCLLDTKGSPIRHIVAAQARSAGKVVEAWDGLDDKGDPLPPGTYQWKGLRHDPLEVKWRLSVHNSGKPGYPTADGKGGWGGDHGAPSAVCASGEIMLLGWEVSECGWSLIATDFDGRKLWGEKWAIDRLVADADTVYAVGEAAGTAGLFRAAVKDKLRGRFEQTGGFAELPARVAKPRSDIRGLALLGDKLYVSTGAALGEIDQRTGKLLRTLTIGAKEVGELAARGRDSLLALIDGKVATVSLADSATRLFAQDHIDRPVSLAVDGKGRVYVGCRGQLQNISVFDSDGRYLRSIGKLGGRPSLGKWDGSGVFNPAGIGIDAKGRLWVAEANHNPKRFSVWDTETGGLVAEYFGGSQYSTCVSMDPEDPTRVYCHGVQWKVDLEKGAWQPEAILGGPDMVEDYLRVFTGPGGQQYAQTRSGLAIRRGDVFEKLRTPKVPQGYWGVWVDETLAIYGSPQEDAQVRRVRPQHIGADGVPDYTGSAIDKIGPGGIKGHGNYAMGDPENGDIYALAGGRFGEKTWPGLCKYSADGKLLWGLWTVGTDWNVALNRGVPPKGQAWGCTRWMGMGGEFIVGLNYFGTIDLWTKDGIYVDKLYQDGRLGVLGPDTIGAEFFFGYFVKTTKEGRYFILAGDQDGRVNELLGLDSVERFAGSYKLTESEARRAAAERAGFSTGGQTSKITIIHKLAGLDWTRASYVKRSEGDKGFRAALAHDGQRLVARYEVDSHAGLINASGEPDLLFHGGNCLDLEIQTNPSADAQREKAALGDVRLIITRQGDKPVAMGYCKQVPGFSGTPKTLVSPTGKEQFDRIAPVPVTLDYQPRPGGFTATVSIPLEAIGLSLGTGQTIRLDLGYRFGDEHGERAGQRLYWSNQSPLSRIIYDVPSEIRMEPANWGTATVE